ncbi:MAG: hypothetical protein K6G52_06830 [Treponemataceae bacterium]|nr:hypothetical protein [Treponemataceae bacterium]
MAIQPIDLQTLYTQMDKVSKTVIQQQQGAALQNSMIQDAKLQKEIENKNVINETKKDEQMNQIKDRNGSAGNGKNGSKKKNHQEEEKNESYVIKDPALGNNLDVFG